MLEGLPGFKLFRIPPRMFLIAALPISLLAGTTTDALFASEPGMRLGTRCRRVAAVVVGILLLSLGAQALLLRTVQRIAGLPALLGGSADPGARRPVAARAGGGPADEGLARRLDWGLASRPVGPGAGPWSRCGRRRKSTPRRAPVQFLADHAEHGRVLDRDAPARLDRPALADALKGNTPLGYAQPFLREIEAVRGLNPIDVYRYKQYLQFISDRRRAATSERRCRKLRHQEPCPPRPPGDAVPASAESPEAGGGSVARDRGGPPARGLRQRRGRDAGASLLHAL